MERSPDKRLPPHSRYWQIGSNRSGWGEVAVIFCNRLSRLHPIPIRLQVQVSSIDLAGERLYQERFHGTHAKSPLNT